MLVEVDYPDGQGTCPFCGEYASKVERGEKQLGFSGYVRNMYPSICHNNHFFVVSVETLINNDEDRYEFIQRLFVYYMDWEDHIDMTIEPGEFNTPLLDNEDDAWLINQKLLKKIQERK